MMRTAADMALDQVQSTDDFFTTGGGYFKDTVGDGKTINDIGYSPYQMATISKTNSLVGINIFEHYTGKNSVEDIYNVVYPKSALVNYINENPKVKDIKFLAGVMDVSYTDSMGTFSSTDSTWGVVDISQTLKWFAVPKIAQLGIIHEANLENEIESANGLGSVTPNAKNSIIKNYELDKVCKQFYSGNNIKYTLTPLSMGITYLNEELLQVFYMNNMELLMRAKYADSNGDLPDGYDGGLGVFKGNSYAGLVDDTVLEEYNPINNGKFTLLMGEKVGSSSVADLYRGLRLPTVEYVVVDMYDNSDKNNIFLKQVLGAKMNKNITISGNNFTYKDLVETSGANFKDLDKETINYYKSILGSGSIFEHKYMVVAKVTFYADVIVPYSTISLREMRARMTTNETERGKLEITGRTLFDPFSEHSDIDMYNASTGLNMANKENYVDLITSIETELTNSAVKDKVNMTFEHINSDPMMYTTFFAVTP